MLIIPIEGKISWRNPPIITISLIVINCIVFFFFQAGDTKKTIEAMTYYFESGLAEIEVPQYQAYVKSGNDQEMMAEDLDVLNPDAINIFMTMHVDSGFMDRLYNGMVITTQDQNYDQWKALRTQFDQKQSRVVSHRFGLIPKRIGPVNFITYMFLHGGIMHLVGNMIFLWIVGCVLEMGCGRIYYGIGYLLVGMFSALFYFVVHLNSYVPMIGASGAISGLMGAFTVLYATTRIRVFISTGFYFDYIKVPALLLLPFWIGKEFFQFYAQGPEQVAYMAHAGGLIGGALTGIAGKQFFDESKKAFFDEQLDDHTPAMMEEALSCSARLDFEGARTHLGKVLEAKPDHIDALMHLFRVDLQHPDESNFHDSAHRLLTAMLKEQQPESEVRAESKVWEVYKDYMNAAKRSRLSPDLEARLVALFFETGHIGASERIVAQLIKSSTDHPMVPTALLRLIRGFEKLKTEKKVQEYSQILSNSYPMSHEAQMLKSNLKMN